MKDENKKFKRNIPGIIKAISYEEDPELIGIYENIMVSMFASVLLFSASIVNFIVRYYLIQESFTACIFSSSILLMLGIGFEIASRAKLTSKTMTIVISMLSFATTVFICTDYYYIIGPAVWTAAFIQVLLAMIRITKTMLYFLTSAIVVCSFLVFMNSYNWVYYQMSSIYYTVQFVLFLIICIIALGVHKVYANRYLKIREQYQESRKNNEDIVCLYEKVAASEEINRYLAYHDHLTGLPNRMFLSEQLNRAIQLSNRKEKFLAVIFLDLDNFKMVNDSMGHTTGDKLLMESSKRLVGILRECDIISRIGGDEFIILVEDAENMDSIKLVAEKILSNLKRPFKINNQEFFVTTSIGISVYPNDGVDADTLIRNADIAMYTSKANGGNQFILCTDEMKNKGVENARLSNYLYHAIERNELELYYQPQVNTVTNKIVGLEALIRWNNKELGLVMPGTFIPVAEKTGLIIPIGNWILERACRQNKAWQEAGLFNIPVSVNMSVRQFQDRNIVERVKEILAETGLEAKYLELEITESVVMKEINYIVEILRAFKKMGISISIDDFGTEYSSLNYLKHLPVDRIKIAMPFIHGIDVSNNDEAITKAIIILAKNMGVRVIAEGVETKKQFEFLSKRMCEEIQGYYYYKPMPAKEIEKLLYNNK
ncbi:MAG: putative bifunctional diguanylate cyclase/phosphodiesterase [Solirubrobacterales bacterium]